MYEYVSTVVGMYMYYLHLCKLNAFIFPGSSIEKAQKTTSVYFYENILQIFPFSFFKLYFSIFLFSVILPERDMLLFFFLL